MEHGFFHPNIGYWQTLTYPKDDILANYPQGSIEIPLKPACGFVWNGTEWVAE